MGPVALNETCRRKCSNWNQAQSPYPIYYSILYTGKGTHKNAPSPIQTCIRMGVRVEGHSPTQRDVVKPEWKAHKARIEYHDSYLAV